MAGHGTRAIAFLLLLLCAGCDACESMCGNEQFEQLASPDGKWKIVSFQRSCGATTGYTTMVSLVSTADALPTGTGNLFAVATTSQHPGSQWLQISWEGPKRIAIRYDTNAHVGLRREELHGIAVEYRPQ